MSTSVAAAITPTYDAQADATALREAMRGIGHNADAMIAVLANRPVSAATPIRHAYKSKFNKDLVADIDSECTFNFKKVMMRLAEDPADRDAKDLRDAIAGLGTKEHVLNEILCTRTAEEINAIKSRYSVLHGKSLVEDVKGDTSGDYRNLLVKILTSDRASEAVAVNQQAAEADAKALYKAGEARLGTNESVFIDILATRSFTQIRAIDQAYTVIAGHNLVKGIAKETSGNFKDALTALATPAPMYFADLLEGAFKGLGTNDSRVIRIMTGSAAMRQMAEIRRVYELKYNRTLVAALNSETSGDYRKVLCALASRA